MFTVALYQKTIAIVEDCFLSYVKVASHFALCKTEKEQLQLRFKTAILRFKGNFLFPILQHCQATETKNVKSVNNESSDLGDCLA